MPDCKRAAGSIVSLEQWRGAFMTDGVLLLAHSSRVSSGEVLNPISSSGLQHIFQSHHRNIDVLSQGCEL